MSSISQDSPDSVLLAILGKSVISGVVEVFTFTLTYGIFVLLFSQETVAYLKEKQTSRAQYWMFLASATTFLLATVQEAALLTSTGILIHSALVGYQDLPLIEKLSLMDRLLMKSDFIILWISTFEPIISDSIVVWRVIVLMQRRKWLKHLPSVLLLGSFALSLASLIFITAGADPLHGFANSLIAAGAGLSLATNIVATTLIGYIYWVHRRDMVEGLGRHQPTRAERVLALLVESGIAYCLPQITSFVMAFVPQSSVHGTGSDYASAVFLTAYLGFSAMYPTIMIALVNSHRTFDHIYSMNASSTRMGHGGEPYDTTTI